MPKHQLVKKKPKLKNPNRMTFQEMRKVEDEFYNELDTNPKFSLDVDPNREYDLTELEVDFIKLMVQYKNVKFVGRVMLNIEDEEAMQIYKKYEVQEEIKRINLAMYARRFCSKMADLDALGGYLTTALTDENVPIADRLSGKDKLTAVRLLMELNQIKSQAWDHPETIDITAIENEIKDLKVDDIKLLIENSSEDEEIINEKDEIIRKLNKDGLLSPEEIAYLRTQSTKELEELVKDIEGGLNDEGK